MESVTILTAVITWTWSAELCHARHGKINWKPSFTSKWFLTISIPNKAIRRVLVVCSTVQRWKNLVAVWQGFIKLASSSVSFPKEKATPWWGDKNTANPPCYLLRSQSSHWVCMVGLVVTLPVLSSMLKELWHRILENQSHLTFNQASNGLAR